MGFRDAEHTSPSCFFSICYFLVSVPEKTTTTTTTTKTNLDCEKTSKIQPPGQTPAGHTCQSKLSQCSSLKDDFLFADDISDKTIPHLSPGCAKNYQQDICLRIWGTAALVPVKMRHAEKYKDKMKKERKEVF